MKTFRQHVREQLHRLLTGDWVSTREYDKKIASYRKLQAELGVLAMPDLHIGVEVKDCRGAVTQAWNQQGHSWNRNGWNMFTMVMIDTGTAVAASSASQGVGYPVGTYGAGFLNGKSGNNSFVGGVSAALQRNSTTYSAGGFYNGIIIGTSAEPFTAEDYGLWAPINSGVGAGLMVYNTMATSVVPVYLTGTKQWTITLSRIFNNNSGASITVNETGLSAGWLNFGGTVSRDVLSAPAVVPNGGQLTISITLTSVSFNALEATAQPFATIGTAHGGGTSLGMPGITWSGSSFLTSSTTNPTSYNAVLHPKWALVMSPKATGNSTAIQWRTTGTALSFIADNSYGKTNTDIWIAAGLGTAAPAAKFAADANTANLAGFNDWYIPTASEFFFAATNQGTFGTEQMNAVNYWVADTFPSNNTTGNVYLGTTGAGTGGQPMTGTFQVRLFRRHKWA